MTRISIPSQYKAAYRCLIVAVRLVDPVWAASRNLFSQAHNHSKWKLVKLRRKALRELLDSYCLEDCMLKWQQDVAQELDGILRELQAGNSDPGQLLARPCLSKSESMSD